MAASPGSGDLLCAHRPVILPALGGQGLRHMAWTPDSEAEYPGILATVSPCCKFPTREALRLEEPFKVEARGF